MIFYCSLFFFFWSNSNDTWQKLYKELSILYRTQKDLKIPYAYEGIIKERKELLAKQPEHSNTGQNAQNNSEICLLTKSEK